MYSISEHRLSLSTIRFCCGHQTEVDDSKSSTTDLNHLTDSVSRRTLAGMRELEGIFEAALLIRARVCVSCNGWSITLDQIITDT